MAASTMVLKWNSTPSLRDAVDLAEAGGERELVLGDAVGVEAAGQRARVVEDGANAAAAELGGAGERGGASADERDGAAGVGRGREWQRRCRCACNRLHGEALQAADRDGLLVVAMQHAGAFAEDIDGAGAGAALAENVGFEDGARGAFEVVAGDLLDEARDVDVGGAGGGAGRIEAVEAAVGFRNGAVRSNGGCRSGKRAAISGDCGDCSKNVSGLLKASCTPVPAVRPGRCHAAAALPVSASQSSPHHRGLEVTIMHHLRAVGESLRP